MYGFLLPIAFYAAYRDLTELSVRALQYNMREASAPSMMQSGTGGKTLLGQFHILASSLFCQHIIHGWGNNPFFGLVQAISLSFMVVATQHVLRVVSSTDVIPHYFTKLIGLHTYFYRFHGCSQFIKDFLLYEAISLSLSLGSIP